ncbi:MAG TPA: hypothetical protein VFL29_09500 [Candidatus Dormibacteraeota bacterium]|nr:hypothetical protein [Candidatus Dormibacteraeota bacterium]
MKKKVALISVFAAATMAAAACGSSSSAYGTPYASPVATSSPAPAPTASAGGTVINVASTRLGTILVDGSGRTLYLFVADKGTSSVCYGQCATYWPPVLTKGSPSAGAGVDAALLGTTSRSDGTVEVTYGGHPLYYFITDKKAGDVTGQGINGFGGPWYVVAPSGMQVS